MKEKNKKLGVAVSIYEKENKGERALIGSFIISLLATAIILYSAIKGSSLTQYADFVRRFAELVAVFVSWIVFRITVNAKEKTQLDIYRQKTKANKLVALAMVLGGVSMIALLFLPRTTYDTPSGIIVGLCISSYSFIVNLILFYQYKNLFKKTKNSIFATQKLHYKAKFIIDLLIAITLCVLLITRQSKIGVYVDYIGTGMVSVYILRNAYVIFRSNKRVEDISV